MNLKCHYDPIFTSRFFTRITKNSMKEWKRRLPFANTCTPLSSAHQITVMISSRKPLEIDIVCFIHHRNCTNWQLFYHFFKNFRKDCIILFSRSPAWRQWGQRDVNNSTWISKGSPLFFICYVYIYIYIFARPESLNAVWVHESICDELFGYFELRAEFYFLVIATVYLKCFSVLLTCIEVSSWKKRSKYVKMFEREKLITNLSLTLLSLANKFDIVVVWKSNSYIYLVKLNVINLTCTEPDLTLVCSGI